MDNYDVTKAARAVSEFTIDHLSNWYVRRCRRRFWKSEMNENKISAYQTLYECLINISKLTRAFFAFYFRGALSEFKFCYEKRKF